MLVRRPGILDQRCGLLWRFRNTRDLRQPSARQAWPKGWLLGSDSRVVGKPTLILLQAVATDGHFAQLRGHGACKDAVQAIAPRLVVAPALIASADNRVFCWIRRRS